MKYFVINIFPVPHVIKPGFYEALSEGKKNPWLVGQAVSKWSGFLCGMLQIFTRADLIWAFPLASSVAAVGLSPCQRSTY